MRSVSRSVSPAAKLAHLEKKHAELDMRLSHLEARPRLPAEEEMERQRLKKLKLATKDEMLAARERL
ncbi:MAG: YdcH family protein [Deltaproteobacteria bacterium]|nr:YdcH family protein [Deltaproteobacteria bacterium]